MGSIEKLSKVAQVKGIEIKSGIKYSE